MSCSSVSSAFIGVLLCQRNHLILSMFGRPSKIFLSSPAAIYLDVTCLNVLVTFFWFIFAFCRSSMQTRRIFRQKGLKICQINLNIGQKCSEWNYCHIKCRQMITTIPVLEVNSLNQLRFAFSCVRNFSVCKLKIAVTKNYDVVVIHHTQWKNSSWLYWELNQYSFFCIIGYRKCSRRALD